MSWQSFSYLVNNSQPLPKDTSSWKNSVSPMPDQRETDRPFGEVNNHLHYTSVLNYDQ